VLIKIQISKHHHGLDFLCETWWTINEFENYISHCRRKSWIVTVVLYPSTLPGRFAFEDTTSCWDTGKIRKRLTPALIPAVGYAPGKCFMIYSNTLSPSQIFVLQETRFKRLTSSCKYFHFLVVFWRDIATMDENGYVKIIGRIKVSFQALPLPPPLLICWVIPLLLKSC